MKNAGLFVILIFRRKGFGKSACFLLAGLTKEYDCMKRLNTILNTIIGAFVGVFIGHGGYVIWNFKTRPELYAMQSAPWYTSILVYGAFTIVVLLICFVIKAIIKRKHKKK